MTNERSGICLSTLADDMKAIDVKSNFEFSGDLFKDENNENMIDGDSEDGVGTVLQALLTVQETDFEFFGDLPEGIQCKIPKETAYARLKRPPLPPLSKKYEDISKFDKDIQQAFQSFFNGDLQIYSVISDNMVDIYGTIPYQRKPIIRYLAARVPASNNNFCWVSNFNDATDHNEFYHSRLTIAQREELSIVMIQRLLREIGAWVKTYLPTLMDLAENIAKKCEQEGMYKDAVDIRLSIADIMINREHEDDIIAINQVAEALEVAKKYKEAAEMYLELAEAKKFRRHKRLSEEKLYGFAGLAFKRSRDYVNAEIAYLASLRIAGLNWHWKNPRHVGPTMNLGNMAVFYESAIEAISFGLCKGEYYKKMFHSCFILLALLSESGFDEFTGIEDIQKILKNKYRSPNKAHQASLVAFMAPSIDEYRRILLSYGNPNTPIPVAFPVEQKSLSEHQADVLRDDKSNSKKSARKQEKAIEKPIMLDLGKICDGCGQRAKDIKFCPCLTVKYCSLECQKRHWTTHKELCPTRKKKCRSAKKGKLKEPSKMSVKELKEAIRNAGLGSKAVGLVEKSEFVKLVQDHRNSHS